MGSGSSAWSLTGPKQGASHTFLAGGSEGGGGLALTLPSAPNPLSTPWSLSSDKPKAATLRVSWK